MPVSASSPVGAAAPAVAPKVGATVASRTSRGRQNMVRLSADSDAQPKQQNRESHRQGLALLSGEQPTAAERPPATPSSPHQTPCPSWATLPTRRCGQMRSTRLAFRWATFCFTWDGRSAFSIEATASAVTSYG